MASLKPSAAYNLKVIIYFKKCGIFLDTSDRERNVQFKISKCRSNIEEQTVRAHIAVWSFQKQVA